MFEGLTRGWRREPGRSTCGKGLLLCVRNDDNQAIMPFAMAATDSGADYERAQISKDSIFTPARSLEIDEAIWDKNTKIIVRYGRTEGHMPCNMAKYPVISNVLISGIVDISMTLLMAYLLLFA
jgi:hypothetical protein